MNDANYIDGIYVLSILKTIESSLKDMPIPYCAGLFLLKELIEDIENRKCSIDILADDCEVILDKTSISCKSLESSKDLFDARIEIRRLNRIIDKLTGND